MSYRFVRFSREFLTRGTDDEAVGDEDDDDLVMRRGVVAYVCLRQHVG